jgi:hypothetical protein
MPALRPGLLVALALAGALAGCMIGPAGRSLAPAQSANGALVTVTAASGDVAGELLAVQPEGMVLLGARVLLVPFAAVREPARVARLVRLEPNVPPTARDRDRLRMLSRFPQGIPPDYLARLLREAGQNDLIVIP